MAERGRSASLIPPVGGAILGLAPAPRLVGGRDLAQRRVWNPPLEMADAGPSSASGDEDLDLADG